MTILWCGGEDIDFPNGTTIISTTAAGSRRTAYSRLAFYGNWAKSTAFSPITSCWCSCQLKMEMFINSYPLFGVYNLSSGKGIYVYTYGSGGSKLLRLYNSDGMLDDSGGDVLNTGMQKVDLKIVDYGVTSTIQVFINGGLIPVIDWSGDSSMSGVDNFDSVWVKGAGSQANMSEFIVADDDTRLMSLKTLAPNAAGDTNDWTGAYTDIDETTISDADFVYTGDKGDDFQANLTGMPAGDFKVRGVKMAARCADPQGILGLKIGVKTNSVVHLGAVKGLVPAYAVIEKIDSINPETATFFTSGEIDALQLALRCDSTTTTTSSTTTTTS